MAPVEVSELTLYGPPPAPLSAELKLIQPMFEDHAQPESGAAAAKALEAPVNRKTARRAAPEIEKESLFMTLFYTINRTDTTRFGDKG
jgi:hypothetical protein